MKKWSMIVLVCVLVVCFVVHETNMRNEKVNKLDTSEECRNVTYTENSQEEQCVPEEQKNYDMWEIEHVLEIGVGLNEYITQNEVVHIGRFIHLKRLKISINDSDIDLSPLGSLVELESLDMDIQDGCSPDLSFMRNLSQLEKLDITVGDDTDLAPLGSLKGLRQLSISTWSGDALDLSFLKKLSHVEEVNIAKCCAVSDLAMFQNMSFMRELDVAYVEDGDLCYLANLINLESLSIIGENIRNPEGLSNLTRLKTLSLCDNSSEALYGETAEIPFDLQLITDLTELEWLDLAYLCIEDVSSLVNLKGLRHISLVKTNVRDISPLADLESISEIFIFGNKSELVKEQAETLFDEVGNVIATENMPNGL